MTNGETEQLRNRPIRSYNARRGRVRPTATRALADHWSTYGIDFRPGEVVAERFSGFEDVDLEIGCGMGEAALAYARNRPQVGLLAIDVHRPGLGVLIRELNKAELNNVRVACIDAYDLLTQHVTDEYFANVRIFFPDPWQKARHNKRRLIQKPFLALVAQRTRIGGTIHLATDWAEYGEQMLQVVNSEPLLANPSGDFCRTRPADRPLTRFERKGISSGHQIVDIIATRVR